MSKSRSTNKRESLERLFTGERLRRPLVSLWCHFPHHDQTPEGLAAATIDYQKRFSFDFVKLTPCNTSMVADWGVEGMFTGDPHGTHDVTRYPIQHPEDWLALGEQNVGYGPLADVIRSLSIVEAEFEGTVPIFQTVFTPLTIAMKLAGERVFDHMRDFPDELKQALSVITSTMERFAEESFDVGAQGIFLATQTARHDLLSVDEFREFGEQYDLRLLHVVRELTNQVILHAHGDNLMFDLLAGYPVAAMNWHDRTTGPSLSEARQIYDNILVGGVDEWNTLLPGPVSAIEAQVRDAVEQVEDGLHIVSAGCVIPYQTPGAHIDAIVKAVRAL
jgi:uroporphyrinogen decarboxylase